MVNFTQQRTSSSPDEFWFCEHPPVFTVGAAVKNHPESIANIPCIQSDRGGKITYHGPGQLVCYPLVDLRRKSIYPKEFLVQLEKVVIATLKNYDVTATTVEKAPGIYVQKVGGIPPFENLAKIGSIGLKISNHCTYHGLSLNISMDLQPFNLIDPCGYHGLRTVNLSDFVPNIDIAEVSSTLEMAIKEYFCD